MKICFILESILRWLMTFTSNIIWMYDRGMFLWVFGERSHETGFTEPIRGVFNPEATGLRIHIFPGQNVLVRMKNRAK